MRRTGSTISSVDVLRQLSLGEILEHQSRSYFLRGDLVPSRLARELVGYGFVEPPPTLFAPIGGRLTASGHIELKRLENRNDV